VNQLTISGVFVARHESARAAALATNGNPSTICQSLKKGSTSAGYRWERADHCCATKGKRVFSAGQLEATSKWSSIPVNQMDDEGILIAAHDSLGAAALAVFVSRSSISEAVRTGGRSGGYRWEPVSPSP